MVGHPLKLTARSIGTKAHEPLTTSPECNLCGGHEFRKIKKRLAAQCEDCRSLERTRLLWMHLEELDVRPEHRILHLAPEPGIYRRLESRVAPGNYICADINPKRYRFAENVVRIDLTDLEAQPSDHYDLIIHSHVMEHVPCNIAYTLFHLERMLTPGGVQVCVIPFLSGKYDECFQDISDEERKRRFGQFDHVRRFGIDDIPRHLGAIVKLGDPFDAVEKFGEAKLRQASIPESAWRGYSIHTVLTLRKGDYKLGAGG